MKSLKEHTISGIYVRKCLKEKTQGSFESWK